MIVLPGREVVSVFSGLSVKISGIQVVVIGEVL